MNNREKSHAQIEQSAIHLWHALRCFLAPASLRVIALKILCLGMSLFITPKIALSQIGLSIRQVSALPRVTQLYSTETVASEFKFLRSPGTAADPATKTYVVYGDRVGGITLEWPASLTLNLALSQLNQIAGLPPLAQNAKTPVWEIDKKQIPVYPPLGAWETRPVEIPGSSSVTGTRAHWSEYYSQWGVYLGRSNIQFTDVVQTYWRHIGDYKFTATKLALPLVRIDSAAYAWLELAGDSEHQDYRTNRVFIAEPEVYWRSRFEECRNDLKRLDNNTGSSSASALKSLLKLRPFQLEVTDLYRRTLLDNVPPDVAGTVLGCWKLNAAVGAVDSPQVSAAVAQELALRCSTNDVCQSLCAPIKTQPIDTMIRRAEMLDTLGSLKWVRPLADKLRHKQTRNKLTGVMKDLAKKHGVTDEQLDAMGSDESRWKSWHAKTVIAEKKEKD